VNYISANSPDLTQTFWSQITERDYHQDKHLFLSQSSNLTLFIAKLNQSLLTLYLLLFLNKMFYIPSQFSFEEENSLPPIPSTLALKDLLPMQPLSPWRKSPHRFCSLLQF